MTLTKDLYILSQLTESQLPQDCGKMYAATHGALFDDPDNPTPDKLNPARLLENIRLWNLKRKTPSILVIDIELDPMTVPAEQYGDLIAIAQADIPNWIVVPYVIPQVGAPYWWAVLNRAQTKHVYVGFQRNNNHPNGIGNTQPTSILALIEWVNAVVLVPSENIIAGIEYWYTEDGKLHWREPSSLVADVGELVRNNTKLAIWNPQPRTPLMDAYRKSVRDTIRTIKAATLARNTLDQAVL
jgi:hypothetical protein